MLVAMTLQVVLSMAAVTDGDGCPAGLSAEQEERWAWQHLRPVVVRANPVAVTPDLKAPTKGKKKKKLSSTR